MMTSDQPSLFDRPPLAPSPAARSGERGVAAVAIAAQTCRSCGHWRSQHRYGEACGRAGCDCQEFVSCVETLSLDTFEPRRLARRTDPPASKAAARKMLARGAIRGHEARILRALREAGEPLTAKEIAACVGLTNVQVARRLGALGKLRSEGLVRVVAGEGEQRFVERKEDEGEQRRAAN